MWCVSSFDLWEVIGRLDARESCANEQRRRRRTRQTRQKGWLDRHLNINHREIRRLRYMLFYFPRTVDRSSLNEIAYDRMAIRQKAQKNDIEELIRDALMSRWVTWDDIRDAFQVWCEHSHHQSMGTQRNAKKKVSQAGVYIGHNYWKCRK